MVLATSKPNEQKYVTLSYKDRQKDFFKNGSIYNLNIKRIKTTNYPKVGKNEKDNFVIQRFYHHNFVLLRSQFYTDGIISPCSMLRQQ